jgi:hypothetical protein
LHQKIVQPNRSPKLELIPSTTHLLILDKIAKIVQPFQRTIKSVDPETKKIARNEWVRGKAVKESQRKNLERPS